MEDNHKAGDGVLQENLGEIMQKNYAKMRRNAGFDGTPRDSDNSDQETEEAFKKLRPKANHNLIDVLTGKVKEPKPKLFRPKSIRMMEEKNREIRRSMMPVNSKNFNFKNL